MTNAVFGLWVATAFLGVYMFTFTTTTVAVGATARGPGDDPTAGAELPSKLPPLTLFVHPLFGLAGLSTWIAYAASDERALAWTTLAILGTGALIGDVLTVKTIGSRRDSELNAEDRIPTAAIATHGLLALATLTLVLLVALGVGD